MQYLFTLQVFLTPYFCHLVFFNLIFCFTRANFFPYVKINCFIQKIIFIVKIDC
jgi:hypothetical protein